MKLKHKYIAVDFDGVLATIKEFPLLGDPIPGASRVLNKVVKKGGKIAIWTCRSGSDVPKVKEFLEKNNIPYHKFNENFDEIVEVFKDDSRKIFCDVYIDDRSIHCKKIDWLEIEELLFEEW